MTDAKDDFDAVDRHMVTKLAEVQNLMSSAVSALEPVRARIQSGQDEKAKQFLPNLVNSIQQASGKISDVRSDLEFFKERIELMKVSYEAREIALRSWPKKAWIERLVWVATALFPAGGVPFVLAGGLTVESLLAAGVMWTVGSITLIWSLMALRREDRERWEFFKREFNIPSKQA